MRITEAARELGISARMLRYRESLGLLPGGPTDWREPGSHRQYDPADLDAVRRCLELETAYDIAPATLAFSLRVLTEPEVAAQIHELGQRLRRPTSPAARALDFEQRRALRWLSNGG